MSIIDVVLLVGPGTPVRRAGLMGCLTRAREIVWRNLQEKLGVRPLPHYIFCTNDEMALGAVDALHMADTGHVDSVVVVGIDGIPEARALIDSRKSPLRATVVQDSCSIAEIAVDLLIKMNRGDLVKKCNYLEPHIYSASTYLTDWQ